MDSNKGSYTFKKPEEPKDNSGWIVLSLFGGALIIWSLFIWLLLNI